MKNPIQPLALDEHGTLRFKENKIVRHLLDLASKHGCTINNLAAMDFTADDREQLMQLIGYSLSAFGGLHFTTDETYNAAVMMTEAGQRLETARIESLTRILDEVRDGMRAGVAKLYGIHPDDLEVTQT